MKRVEKEIRIYKFVRKNVGRQYTGCHLKAMFGLSPRTEYHKTALRKYTIHCGKTGRYKSAPNVYEINDVIWVPQETLKKNDMNMFFTYLWTPLLGLNLIEKIKIPWHLLADHGGPITDHELQDAYKARFPFGPP
jgi:hypothetical protein